MNFEDIFKYFFFCYFPLKTQICVDGGFKAPQLPSGLECLAFVDQLVLNQKVEYFTCVRTTEFAIKNIRGERVIHFPLELIEQINDFCQYSIDLFVI